MALIQVNPVHDEEETCDQCGEQFEMGENLRKHVEREHTVEKRSSYGCKVCNEEFRMENDVITHIKAGLGIS